MLFGADSCNLSCVCVYCVSFPGRPLVLSQSGQVLQIQTPQTIAGHVVTMPTLSQDRLTPVAAPPVVSVTLRAPSSEDDDVSPGHNVHIHPLKSQSDYMVVQLCYSGMIVSCSIRSETLRG